MDINLHLCLITNPLKRYSTTLSRKYLQELKDGDYDYNSTSTVKYKPEKSNAADYMSRHPDMKLTMFKHAEIAEHYVHYI